MTLSQLTSSSPQRTPSASRVSWAAPFVGRATELAALVDLVHRPDRRWITLTGRSGVGKTRLLEALETQLATFPGPVILAEPLAGPVGHGLERVARALGVTPPVRSLGTAVARIIGSAPTVLVLDDATADGARGVSSLLDRCPRLVVVAASIVALGVPGETPYRVGGLDPAAARQLFLERASRTTPGLVVDERTHREVVQICTELHGIPLDLEIAAAQVRTLGTGGLASQLAERGDGQALLLEASTTSARSVGSAVALSYGRVGPNAQQLLRALSVFHGPFTLEQARAVQPGEDDRLMDSLTELVDAWLVEPVFADTDPGGAARFVLAPLVRRFADSAAARADERPGLRARHAEHHARVARQWAVQVDDAREGDGLRSLVHLLPELFAAAEWYESAGDLSSALRVAADLAPVAQSQGNARAVSGLLTALLSAARATSDAHLLGDAQVWLAQALLSAVEGEDSLNLALEHWSEGLRLLRESGDERAVLRALAIGAQALPVSRDPEHTRSVLAEGLALAERLGSPAWTARFEVWSGMLAHQLRRFDEAWRLGLSTLARSRRIGDRHGEVAACLLLIPLVGDFPDPPGGVPTARELLTLCQSMHDASLASLAMGFLAEQALDEGDPSGAARWIASRLSGIQNLAAWRSSGYSIMLTARLAVLMGDRSLAARLHGALLPMLPTLLAGCPPRYADRYTDTMDELRASLGVAGFDRLAHDGSLIPWAEAMALADAEVNRLAAALPDPTEPVVGPSSPEPPPAGGPLSSRENEVLGLISAGLTNREIAQRLHVTAKTVMHHSVAIYRKLGVRGRAEAVAWFVRSSG